ncbi:MAG TPA: branched-chain amino acid ABC transporter permease [Stellaceae bacterium]|nr:branched-chain amino acid ABC transporter permease [Stellaceae bacterium]
MSARQGLLHPGFLVLVLVMALLPLGLANNFWYDLAIKVGLNAMIAVGLNLLIGYAGQISLGHAAFFAIGAYASAILTSHYGIPGLLALLLGALIAGLLAWAVARPILRLSGHYLAMATLGLGIIISIVINREIALTGGPDGMAVPTLYILGWAVRGAPSWYWIVATCLALTTLFSLNLMNSAFGRGLRALSNSEIAAASVGLDTAAMKVKIFVVSAIIAALAGSLFAHAELYVTPDESGFLRSVELVTMVVVGGQASTFGAVIGAGLLTILTPLLAGAQDWRDALFGAILVATMIFLPRGLVPSLRRLVR